MERGTSIDGTVLREIERCEWAVMFFGCSVVGFGGFDLGSEVAEVEVAAVGEDRRGPFVLRRAVRDSFVLRGRRPAGLGSVPGVLEPRGEAQVGFAIVQAVLVDMIDVHARRRFDYFAVHVDGFGLAVAQADLAHGVDCPRSFGRVPLVPHLAIVVRRVHDGAPVLRERYSPEAVAEANPPIQKHAENEQAFEPDRKIERDPNVPLLRLAICKWR